MKRGDWDPVAAPCPFPDQDGERCGEPEVSPNVGCCYDHAKLCPECDTQPAFPGKLCPSCTKMKELANGMGGAQSGAGHAEPEAAVEGEA